MTKQIEKTANTYLACFESNTREATGKVFYYLPNNAPQELLEAVRNAHGEKLPSDWIYETFVNLLQKVTEYTIENIDQLREYAHEIVDGSVDIYTHELTLWLHEEQALEHLSQVMASHSYSEEDGAWQVLAATQYSAIDEIMQHVIDLIENNLD